MGLIKKKSLGQHFILNPTTIQKIVKVAGVKEGDSVLEIGPGPGILTRELCKTAKRVVAVEKDHRFASLLNDELKEFKNLELVEDDFLKTNLETLLKEGKWKVVANLPYNVATEAIFHLLEKNLFFDSLYLMVQKEVAERLAAPHGSRTYGILSIFSQLLSENKVVMTLPPGAFTPPPKVWSAIVEFKVSETPRFDIQSLPLFEKVVHSAFSKRRKMIRNGLKSVEGAFEAMEKVGIDPTTRPEQVSIEGFVKLANLLNKMASSGS